LGFGDTNDVNIFVAKVTDVHLNSCIIPNIQSEAEVSLSVEFYADESGLIHVPTEPLFIRRERCDLEFLFGKLTKEQLASLKQALEREGGELCYRLAQF
jgi:hypothetical protein